jgi:hypothetical protein
MNEPIDTDYDIDFLLWINRQVELLRAKQFDQLDLENLIEELDAMARRDQRELASRIRVLMMHLLKCRLQPEHISSNWRGTLDEQRSQIALLLKDMPSLNNAIEAYMADAYPVALGRAADETGLPQSAFPASCPFSKEQLLDRGYLG